MVQRVKKIIPVLLFVGVLLAGMQGMVRLLYPMNDVVRNWGSFYALKRESVDILIVGSSHAYVTFDVALMEEVTGKKVYILASDAQNVEQAYFNVKEALRYQKPGQIVLEAYSLDSNDNYRNAFYHDRDWKKESNIDGMRFGAVKVEAILAQYTFQDWMYAFFPISRCHGNWSNLEQMRENLNFYGKEAEEFQTFRPRASAMSEDTMQLYAEAEYDGEKFQMADSNVRYFHKLAKLCRKNNIELKIVMAPMYDVYVKSVNYESRTGQVAALASQEELAYLDCNLRYEEIGLTAQDFEDVYNPNHHLNVSGAGKTTRFVLEEWE